MRWRGTLGHAVVAEFVRRGDRVIAVGRRHAGDLPEGVGREMLDLTVPAEVDALWARVADRGERPRWVVNTAGGYAAGAVVETDDALPAQRIRVNAVLPSLIDTPANRASLGSKRNAARAVTGASVPVYGWA